MGIKDDEGVIRWQIWCTYDPYRKVHIMRCPNIEGVMVEAMDKEQARYQVINQVCGYINDCKNSGNRVQMVPAPDEIPASVIEVIQMNSR